MLIGGVVIGVIAGIIAATPQVERPRVWFGFGRDGGLIIDHQPASDLESLTDAERDASTRLWLGPNPSVVAVDVGSGFYVEATTTPLDSAEIGKRFEVLGEKGSCIVEVTGGMRAALRATSQFGDGGEPGFAVYRGPGARYEELYEVEEDPKIITPADLESDYPGDIARFSGRVVRVVKGRCPRDGLVAPRGSLRRVAVKVAKRKSIEEVRMAFRSNAWVAAAEREYHAETEDLRSDYFGCEDRPLPQHIDLFAPGLRARSLGQPRKPALLLVESGSESYCDPSRIGLVFRRDGARWVHINSLWGAGIPPTYLTLFVYDVRSGYTWATGFPLVLGSRGWDRGIMAIDVGGFGQVFGGDVGPVGHMCNYASTMWEFAELCPQPPAD